MEVLHQKRQIVIIRVDNVIVTVLVILQRLQLIQVVEVIILVVVLQLVQRFIHIMFVKIVVRKAMIVLGILAMDISMVHLGFYHRLVDLEDGSKDVDIKAILL